MVSSPPTSSDQLFLGLDLGTSYFKVGLFDERGGLAGLGRLAVEVERPAPGRCELPVERFWKLLRAALSDALAQARADVRQIRGVSYASQANTFLLLDRGNEPLTPMVIWTDARTERIDDDLAMWSRTDAFAGHTGFRGLTGQWAAAKLRWFQAHEPGLWSRTAAVMTLSDYLTFGLTGTRAGDAGTAAFLGLYDLHASAWWPEALARISLEPGFMSAPLRPGTVCGRTTELADDRLGLPPGIPFAVGGIDHQIAALGSGMGSLASASLSLGTVLAAIAPVDQPGDVPGCFHGPHVPPCPFFRLAFDPNGAGQLEHYQQRECPGWSIDCLIELATAGRAPRDRPEVSHQPAGESDHATAVREILQRIADTQRALLDALLPGRTMGPLAVTGGGARSAAWMQVEADALASTIIVPGCPEAGCLGAAVLAATAAGAYPAIDAAAKAMVRAGTVYEPRTG